MLRLPEIQLQAYLAGFTDGMTIGSMTWEKSIEIAVCLGLSGWSAAQVSQIFKNYANAHPEKWNEQPSASIHTAFVEACDEESNESAPSPPGLEDGN
jgi:hypothetical protein